MWKDSSGLAILTFLPGLCNCLNSFQVPKPRLQSKTNKRFRSGDYHTLHWGYHSRPQNGSMHWTLFTETNIALLKQLKQQIIQLDRTLQKYHLSDWKKKRAHVPPQHGLFGTVWTSLAINYSPCQWHVDKKDVGLTALVYMGDFEGGEVKLGLPFDVQIPVQNEDLVFLQGSKVFHKSAPFTGNRINLVFYTDTINNVKFIPCPELF